MHCGVIVLRGVEFLAGWDRVIRGRQGGCDTCGGEIAEPLWHTPFAYPVSVGVARVCRCHSGERNSHGCRYGGGEKQFLEHETPLLDDASVIAHTTKSWELADKAN
jgi:hypothetical protein